MRKMVLSFAAATAALAVAAPAAAQYYQAPPPAPGYGQGYGHGYGHGNWQQVRDLRVRIDMIRRQITRLDRRDAIRGRTADRLLNEADRIDRRLRERARGGLDPREAADLHYRVQRLEQQVQWARAGRWDRFRDGRY